MAMMILVVLPLLTNTAVTAAQTRAARMHVGFCTSRLKTPNRLAPQALTQALTPMYLTELEGDRETERGREREGEGARERESERKRERERDRYNKKQVFWGAWRRKLVSSSELQRSTQPPVKPTTGVPPEKVPSPNCGDEVYHSPQHEQWRSAPEKDAGFFHACPHFCPTKARMGDTGCGE